LSIENGQCFFFGLLISSTGAEREDFLPRQVRRARIVDYADFLQGHLDQVCQNI
jgi:hypothetical protein